MTELFAADFIWDSKRRTFRAVRSQLAYPMTKPIEPELLLRDCWGINKRFRLAGKRGSVSRYLEQGADLERPLKLVVVDG